MKTAISIPDAVFEEADRLARTLGKSRSDLYVTALTAYLEAHRRLDVTARLNQIYSRESSAMDPVLQDLQAASLAREDW